jgi:hypothetical protein
MIRIPIQPTINGAEDEAHLFSDLLIARPEKYWSSTNPPWTPSGTDPNRSIPPSSIDFVTVLDSSKSWEHLRLAILCSICTEQIVNHSFSLERVHWKYLHCKRCPQFFACGGCIDGASPSLTSTLRSHRQHGELVKIETRPFWWPLCDGSDLDQLVALREAKSADEFFLYFPWFFHCFSGMDTVRLVSQQTLLQELRANTTNLSSMQSCSKSLTACYFWPKVAKRSTLARSQTEINSIIRFFETPVDWFLRIFVTGNWRQLHQGLQSVIEDRIQVAKSSSRLNKLLRRFRGFVEEKERRYGNGDILLPDVPLPGSVTSSLPALPAGSELSVRGNYVHYLLPLHFWTIQNDEIDKAKLKTILHSDYSTPLPDDFTETDSAVPSPARGPLAAAGDSGVSLSPESTGHLTNLVMPEVRRLWPMFNILFGDDEEFEKLDKLRAFNDLIPQLEFMVR